MQRVKIKNSVFSYVSVIIGSVKSFLSYIFFANKKALGDYVFSNNLMINFGEFVPINFVLCFESFHNMSFWLKYY